MEQGRIVLDRIVGRPQPRRESDTRFEALGDQMLRARGVFERV